MNRKATSTSIVVLTIMVFVLVSASLFTFYQNFKEVKTTLIDSYFVNKFYSSESDLEIGTKMKLEEILVLKYVDSLESNNLGKSSEFLINEMKKILEDRGFKYTNLKYKEGIFYFDGELKDPIQGRLDRSGVWNWGEFLDKDDYALGAIYRPKIDFEIELANLDLIDFGKYNEAIEKCKLAEDRVVCLNSELIGFNAVKQNENKIILVSKRAYLLNGKLDRIKLEVSMT